MSCTSSWRLGTVSIEIKVPLFWQQEVLAMKNHRQFGSAGRTYQLNLHHDTLLKKGNRRRGVYNLKTAISHGQVSQG